MLRLYAALRKIYHAAALRAIDATGCKKLDDRCGWQTHSGFFHFFQPKKNRFPGVFEQTDGSHLGEIEGISRAAWRENERLGLQKKKGCRSVLLIARGTGGAGNVSCRGQRSLHASIPCEKRNSAAVKGFALSGSFAFSARHKASRVQPHC